MYLLLVCTSVSLQMSHFKKIHIDPWRPFLFHVLMYIWLHLSCIGPFSDVALLKCQHCSLLLCQLWNCVSVYSTCMFCSKLFRLITNVCHFPFVLFILRPPTGNGIVLSIIIHSSKICFSKNDFLFTISKHLKQMKMNQ